MSGEAEAAVRRTVEALVDREVEHLRALLELRLVAIVREIVNDRLPIRESAPRHGRLLDGLLTDLPTVCAGRGDP